MIATHNVKVNGRWVHAGEEYGEKEAPRTKAEDVKAEEPEKAEAKKAETKPKTVTRRKGTR